MAYLSIIQSNNSARVILITGDILISEGGVATLVNQNNYSPNSEMATTGDLANNTSIVSSNINLTGASLINITDSLRNNLIMTGLWQENKINNTGASLISITNTLNSNLINTGSSLIGLINIANNNLNTTGSNLDGKIAMLSGGLQSTGSNLIGQINSINSQTGSFINSSQTGVYATAQNLNMSGASLENKIIIASGNLASTGSILTQSANALSASLTNTGANLIQITNTLASNLSLTGSNLINITNVVSGNINSTGSSLVNITNSIISNLSSTGVLLENKINNTGGSLINVANILSGNILGTGNSLLNLINVSSGNLNNSGAFLQNQINNLSVQPDLTGLQITGGNVLFGQIKVEHAGTVVVKATGQVLLISGIASTGVGISQAQADTLYYSINNPSGFINSNNSLPITGGTLSGELNVRTIQGSNISIRATGDIVLPPINHPPLSSFTNEDDVSIYNKFLAKKSFISIRSRESGPDLIQHAFFSNNIQMIGVGGAAITNFGCTPTNSGTLTASSAEDYGYTTNIQSVNGRDSLAGTCGNTASIYRGSFTGKNGFFFSCSFGLPDATGTYITGVNSGARFFCGLTDQAFGPNITLNNPAGNRIGFSLLRATGTSSFADTGFFITSKNNTTETRTETFIPWNSGSFKASLYCPPFPNNTEIFWELEDVGRRLLQTGFITGTLPIGSTAMRQAIWLNSVSGSKNLRLQNLYIEV